MPGILIQVLAQRPAAPHSLSPIRPAESFVWLPGVGINAAALARFRTRCSKPSSPMGEAWFMGEQRVFFHELMGDTDHLSVATLQQALKEIASGTSSFGPRQEWRDWYHYLLGQLLPRCHEHHVASLLELALATSEESGACAVDALLPASASEAVLATVKAYFTEDRYRAWLESVAAVPALAAELATIPSRFERLYLD